MLQTKEQGKNLQDQINEETVSGIQSAGFGYTKMPGDALYKILVIYI